MNTDQNIASSSLARRFVEMGLAPTPPAFPPGGVPLLKLVPYWRLWPRDPQRNSLDHPCAAIFPVIAQGIAPLNPGSSAPQAVFAALLPIHTVETAVAQWTNYTIVAAHDASFGGPSSPATVLEALLENRPDGERIDAWRRVLEGLFDFKGDYLSGDSKHAVTLLECVGRTGLRALAPLVCPILQNSDQEIVLAALACLARLGVPDVEMPVESLLNRLRAETVDKGRAALAFLESGDIDRLDGLLGADGWLERVQGLRLAEAVLCCGPMVERLGEDWLHHLVDLLLARLQRDHDRDVVRCLATTLGLALRRCSDRLLERLLLVAGQITEEGRFESLLNALLVAGLPSSAAARIETLRGASFALGRGAARALNRVMMALGEPCGCVFDWLNADIVVLRQTGVLSLPDAVQNWFDFPERCPEAQVASWLRGPGDDDLASMFCAAYLVGRPTFLKVLERLWIEAIYDGDADQLQLTGGLLAGAADDCAVSPVELRCCLGYKVGGPVPESPENAGRLLGMVLNQNGGVRKSAEALLLQMSPEYRIVAAGALRWLPHNRNPFGNEGAHPSRFGAPASPLDHASLLPPSLQPLFSMGLMKGCPPKVLLETICFGNGRKEGWAGRCIDWCNPETVQAVFLDIDSTELAGVFLSVSASPHVDMRRIAVPLAAGVGPRLLQTSYRDRIIQRLVDLAQEPDNQTRTAVARAVQRLGIADLVPVAPASAASTPDANTPGTSNIPETSEESEEETLDRLVAELEGDF